METSGTHEGDAAPNLDEERAELSELIMDEPPLKEGQTWYLVATRWYQQWEEYVQIGGDRGNPGPHPGPIDNSPILQEDGSILQYARERQDFVIRSEAVWKRLEELYGGGPPIPRKVVASMWTKSVETHPYKLTFLKSSDMDTLHYGLFSKGAKIKEVRNTMCERMGLSVEDVRMWDYHREQKLKILEDPLCTLAEERIMDGQKLLFEERLENGKWPSLATKRDREFEARNRERVEPGLCGLNNLGNTCFMNSGLQCLSNTAVLAQFMVSGEAETQINRDNPLGTKGELLTEFAELLQDIWSGRMSAVAPRDFKWKLERFAPQFSGWQQHDSHELLAFLLDGLHEDLNRVKKKPYFETNEFEGIPEEEAAAKSWSQHIARNDSFITDYCHGLLRSEVNCNVCDRVSKVFDPFMYLSVPLPEAKTRTIYVLVWRNDFSQIPIRYLIEVPKHGKIQDLVDVVAEKTGIENDLIHVADIYSQRFFKHFKRDEKISIITDRDVIFCMEGGCGVHGPKEREDAAKSGDEMEVDADTPQDEEPRIVDIPILWKSEETQSTYFSSSVQKVALDPPVIIGVPETATYKEYYDLFAKRFERFFTFDSEEQAEEGEKAEGAEEEEAEGENQKLFRFYLTDRYGQPAAGQSGRDEDEEIRMTHGQTVLIVVGGEGCKKNAFNKKGAAMKVDDASCNVAESGESGMSLSQCITLFGEKEQLSEEDPWYCSKCQEHRQAFKKFDLWSLPKILMIQLKRFSYRSRHWREKIETLVDFPLEGLDLSEHVLGPIKEGEEPIYDLYAIDNHFGALGGGHYTAFAQNANNKKWYKFDDSSVSEVEPKSVVTGAAYILFYKRRDVKLPENFKMPVPVKYANEEEEEEAQEEGEEAVNQDDVSTLTGSDGGPQEVSDSD